MGYSVSPGTGASVAPSEMDAQAANTYLANNTAASASPTAVVMPYVVDPNATNGTTLGWTYDITQMAVAGQHTTPAAATIYLCKIPIPKSITITNIICKASTAGTSYTNAQLGLWDSTGTFLSASAVQASAGANGFGVTTPVTLPLAASQAIVGSPTQFVWVGLHMGTNNATAAIFAGLGSSAFTSAAMLNLGTTTSTLRVGTYTGHATNSLATIGNLTPTSMVSVLSFIWFGIS